MFEDNGSQANSVIVGLGIIVIITSLVTLVTGAVVMLATKALQIFHIWLWGPGQ